MVVNDANVLADLLLVHPPKGILKTQKKYDPAQRVDSFIYHNEKEFQTSKSSKWQRGRRIVSYLTDIFDTIQQVNPDQEWQKLMDCDKKV